MAIPYPRQNPGRPGRGGFQLSPRPMPTPNARFPVGPLELPKGWGLGLRGAGRLFPMLGIALAIWDLYQLYKWFQGRTAMGFPGYSVMSDCGQPEQYYDGVRSYGCAPPQGAYVRNTPPPNQFNPVQTYKFNGPFGAFDGGNPAKTYGFVGPGPWSWSPSVPVPTPPVEWPAPLPDLGGQPTPFSDPHPDPAPWVAPMVDPFSNPINQPVPEVPPLPYPMIPHRVPNPWRSPTEGPQRGYDRPQEVPLLNPFERPALTPVELPAFVPSSPGVPGPTFRINPNSNPSASPRPVAPPAPRNPTKPPPGTTEVKHALVGPNGVWKMANVTTETRDVVRELWKGLDDKWRAQQNPDLWRIKGPKGGTSTTGKFAGPRVSLPTMQKMMDDIMRGALEDKMDWKKAIDNVIQDQLMDRFYGKLGRKAAEMNRTRQPSKYGTKRPIGTTSGPLHGQM